MKRSDWLAAWAACWLGLTLVGCEQAELRVPPASGVDRLTTHNDLVLVEYRGMAGPVGSRGIVAATITNRSEKLITISGERGEPVPTKNDQRAWLVYRGSEDVRPFATADHAVEFKGLDSTFTLEVPMEEPRSLQPGESTTVMVAYEVSPQVDELSFDLSPMVSHEPVHDAQGELRALYVTVPVRDRPTMADRAKQMMKQTSLGINLTSDDVMY
jgi:hypothetical protein